MVSGALSNGHSFAIWKPMGSGSIEFIMDKGQKGIVPCNPDLEKMAPSFLVSPFDNESNFITYPIHADIHLHLDRDGEQVWNVAGSGSTDTDLLEKLNNWVKQDHAHCKSHYTVNDPLIKEDYVSKKQYISRVKKAIADIEAGIFSKAVPARKEIILLAENHNLIDSFFDLVRMYPYAFVSLFHLKDHGIWMGASPEILIQLRENQFFTTTAVAGTQLFSDEKPLAKVGWTQKEIVEQAMVSRYIINCFKKIRLREFEESGPKTVKAGNMVHLRTDFTVDMKAVNFPQLGTVMLKLLHPTSAICGMPKETSMAFIENSEDFSREFFSGYIGPVNINHSTDLFVNIRCANLFHDHAVLYAGAGVTIDSDPEKEWEETELKLNTMKDVLAP